jgi:hypothetical protein
MTTSVSKYGHLQYTFSLADIQAGGAVTTFDFPVDSLPPGAIVLNYFIKNAAAGPAGATARPKLNGTALGAGTSDMTVTTGSNVFNTVSPASATAANPLVLTIASTGNLSAWPSGGPITFTINYAAMGT